MNKASILYELVFQIQVLNNDVVYVSIDQTVSHYIHIIDSLAISVMNPCIVNDYYRGGHDRWIY